MAGEDDSTTRPETRPPERDGYLLWLERDDPPKGALCGEIERARTSERRRFESGPGLLRELAALAGTSSSETECKEDET
jgi:hypothetical protein